MVKPIEKSENIGKSAQALFLQPGNIIETNEHRKYRVVECIGRGGMGDVYKVVNVDSNTGVDTPEPPSALKLNNKQDDSSRHERFMQEGRIGAMLQTAECSCFAPVQAYGFFQMMDTDDDVTCCDSNTSIGTPYILMEYIQGATLDEILKRAKGKYSEGENAGKPLIDDSYRFLNWLMLHVAEELAKAIAVLREMDIIHRDIKLKNIMLTAEGKVKLLDFGTALYNGITFMEGAKIVSIPFTSPEQMENSQDVDIRSDLYSLGMVLYYIVSGRQWPYGTKMTTISEVQSLIRQKVSPVDVRNRESRLPASVAELLNALLVQERDYRLSSLEELTSRLDACRNDFDKNRLRLDDNDVVNNILPKLIEPGLKYELADIQQSSIIVTKTKIKKVSNWHPLVIVIVMICFLAFGMIAYLWYQRKTDKIFIENEKKRLEELIVKSTNYRKELDKEKETLSEERQGINDEQVRIGKDRAKLESDKRKIEDELEKIERMKNGIRPLYEERDAVIRSCRDKINSIPLKDTENRIKEIEKVIQNHKQLIEVFKNEKCGVAEEDMKKLKERIHDTEFDLKKYVEIMNFVETNLETRKNLIECPEDLKKERNEMLSQFESINKTIEDWKRRLEKSQDRQNENEVLWHYVKQRLNIRRLSMEFESLHTNKAIEELEKKYKELEIGIFNLLAINGLKEVIGGVEYNEMLKQLDFLRNTRKTYLEDVLFETQEAEKK